MPSLPGGWIAVAEGAPYFVDEEGSAFTPIGQNDAITWPELRLLYRRQDPGAVERHLHWLRSQGVTVMRLMLEYAEAPGRYFEKPFGRYVPAMVRLWDDLFALCEKVGMRLLLTPFDTFWTWMHWDRHPYNRANGGPLDHPSRLLLCRETREGIKRRLAFAAERWGGSPALFAWDLWNEIHPAQAQNSADSFGDFIHDLSGAVTSTEMRLFGRRHPQTVSLYGPELRLRPDLPMREPIFRHPDLDFANIHVYGSGAIDNPKDTVAPAVSMGRAVRECLAEIHDVRPFFDSEHGPIHSFKDRGRTLAEAFDDEYFHHIQWAHLASGGAGGGMRWPNRHPHVLTVGMRRSQAGLARFLPLMDWTTFRRTNLNQEIAVSRPVVARFACGDDRQALVWLLRRTALAADGRVRTGAPPVEIELGVPGLADGAYTVACWDTRTARLVATLRAESRGGMLAVRSPPFVTDLAFAIRRAP